MRIATRLVSILVVLLLFQGISETQARKPFVRVPSDGPAKCRGPVVTVQDFIEKMKCYIRAKNREQRKLKRKGQKRQARRTGIKINRARRAVANPPEFVDASGPANFDGNWNVTSYGWDMSITHNPGSSFLIGSWTSVTENGNFDGTVSGRTVTGTWTGNVAPGSGTFTFTMNPGDNSWGGQFTANSTTGWAAQRVP